MGCVIVLVGVVPERPHGVRNHYVLRLDLRHSCLVRGGRGGIDVRQLQTKHQTRIVEVVIEDTQVGGNTLESTITPPVGERRPATRNRSGDVEDLATRRFSRLSRRLNLEKRVVSGGRDGRPCGPGVQLVRKQGLARVETGLGARVTREFTLPQAQVGQRLRDIRGRRSLIKRDSGHHVDSRSGGCSKRSRFKCRRYAVIVPSLRLWESRRRCAGETQDEARP